MSSALAVLESLEAGTHRVGLVRGGVVRWRWKGWSMTDSAGWHVCVIFVACKYVIMDNTLAWILGIATSYKRVQVRSEI